jgi:hypothetical protein
MYKSHTGIHNTYIHTNLQTYVRVHMFYIHTYRVIQEESARLWEMRLCVILSKKVHINMCPIFNGYGVMGIFNSRTRPTVNRALTRWRVT